MFGITPCIKLFQTISAGTRNNENGGVNGVVLPEVVDITTWEDTFKSVVNDFQSTLNEEIFPHIKFATSDKEWEHDSDIAFLLMDGMGINENVRKRWWKKNRNEAKKRFNRRRNNLGRKIRVKMEGKW